MTSLQQMAFERLTKINKEVRELLPSSWHPRDPEMSMPMEDFRKVQELLFEQKDLCESLWDEERKDGCEETI